MITYGITKTKIKEVTETDVVDGMIVSETLHEIESQSKSASGAEAAQMMIADGLDPAELDMTEQGNPMEPLPKGAVKPASINPRDFKRE